jgi:uncharacterized protein
VKREARINSPMNSRMFEFIVALGFCILVLSATSQARAASFDCKKATIEVEKLICSDKTLSKLDSELAEFYAEHLQIVRPDERQDTKAAQLEWLRQRNRCNKMFLPHECVRILYDLRLKVLVSWFDSVSWASYKQHIEWEAFRARMALHDQIDKLRKLDTEDRRALHAQLETSRSNPQTCEADARDWSCAQVDVTLYRHAYRCLERAGDVNKCISDLRKNFSEEWQPWLFKGTPISPACFLRSNALSVFHPLRDFYGISSEDFEVKVLNNAAALYGSKPKLPPSRDKEGEPLYYNLALCNAVSAKAQSGPSVDGWSVSQQFCADWEPPRQGKSCEKFLANTYKSIRDLTYSCSNLKLPTGVECIEIRRAYFVDDVDGTKLDDRHIGYYALVRDKSVHSVLWLGKNPTRKLR